MFNIISKEPRNHFNNLTDTKKLCDGGVQRSGNQHAHCVQQVRSNQCNQCNQHDRHNGPNCRDKWKTKIEGRKVDVADYMSIRVAKRKKWVEKPWSLQANQRKYGNMKSKDGDTSRRKRAIIKSDNAQNDYVIRSGREVTIRKIENQFA